jgi:hypothetical protein
VVRVEDFVPVGRDGPGGIDAGQELVHLEMADHVVLLDGASRHVPVGATLGQEVVDRVDHEQGVRSGTNLDRRSRRGQRARR